MFIKMFRFISPLFNPDDGGSGGEAPATATAPAPVTTSEVAPVAATPAAPVTPVTVNTPPLHNALRTGTIAPVVTPQIQPVITTPAAVEEIDFGGRKVKVTDPVISEIAKDYKELTGTLTRETQRAKDLETENNRLKGIANQPPVTPQPAPEVVEPVKPTPERIKEINEKYLEMAYENPYEAQVWLNQQPEFQQVLSPIQKQNVETYLTETQQKENNKKNEFQQLGKTMETKHEDFKAMVPHMQTVIERFPSIGEKLANNPTIEAFEEAYQAAKLISGQTAPLAIPTAEPPASNQTVPNQPVTPATQPQTIEQMLADPEAMKQILANPLVNQSIINNYVSGVSNAQQQMPHVIGNGPGGNPPAMPRFEPKDIKEAGKGFRDFVRRNPTT